MLLLWIVCVLGGDFFVLGLSGEVMISEFEVVCLDFVVLGFECVVNFICVLMVEWIECENFDCVDCLESCCGGEDYLYIENCFGMLGIFEFCIEICKIEC